VLEERPASAANVPVTPVAESVIASASLEAPAPSAEPTEVAAEEGEALADASDRGPRKFLRWPHRRQPGREGSEGESPGIEVVDELVIDEVVAPPTPPDRVESLDRLDRVEPVETVEPGPEESADDQGESEDRPSRFSLRRRKEKEQSALRSAMETAVERSFSTLPEGEAPVDQPAATQSIPVIEAEKPSPPKPAAPSKPPKPVKSYTFPQKLEPEPAATERKPPKQKKEHKEKESRTEAPIEVDTPVRAPVTESLETAPTKPPSPQMHPAPEEAAPAIAASSEATATAAAEAPSEPPVSKPSLEPAADSAAQGRSAEPAAAAPGAPPKFVGWTEKGRAGKAAASMDGKVPCSRCGQSSERGLCDACLDAIAELRQLSSQFGL